MARTSTSKHILRLPNGFSAGDKTALIKQYISQNPAAYGGYLLAFAKEDELLFRAFDV